MTWYIRNSRILITVQHTPLVILSSIDRLAKGWILQSEIFPFMKNFIKFYHERKNPHQVANFSNYLFTIWNYYNRIYSELIRIENWERFQKIKFSKMKLAAWIIIGAQDCFLILISRSQRTNFSARWSLIMILLDFNTNWKWF